ncbi:unnamed protein product, partial [Mesorhabditis spiculigera]
MRRLAFVFADEDTAGDFFGNKSVPILEYEYERGPDKHLEALADRITGFIDLTICYIHVAGTDFFKELYKFFFYTEPNNFLVTTLDDGQEGISQNNIELLGEPGQEQMRLMMSSRSPGYGFPATKQGERFDELHPWHSLVVLQFCCQPYSPTSITTNARRQFISEDFVLLNIIDVQASAGNKIFKIIGIALDGKWNARRLTDVNSWSDLLVFPINISFICFLDIAELM